MNNTIAAHRRNFPQFHTPSKLADLDEVIVRSRAHLLGLQHDDGYWAGELEGDTILESEYAILLTFLGRADHPKIRKLANTIRQKQNDDGGWGIYPGGPTDISASVKAYWTLKLAGHSPEESFMRTARDRIRSLGGITKVNTFTKIYLCVLGLYDWSGVPAIPPAMILFPNWFYFNIYEMSSWSRAILVPLSIIWAKKPKCEIPEHAKLDELFVGGRAGAKMSLGWDRKVFTWRNLLLTVDWLMKFGATLHLTPLRDKAVEACEEWMLKRFWHTHGLAAIFPPMVNAVMAMRALGYSNDNERVRWMLQQIEKLEIEEADTLRVQPCFSVIWDTAISICALSLAGTAPDDPAMKRAACWLLSKEVRHEGDWKVKAPNAEPGGWFFEFENAFYPDVDDTAMVLIALSRVRLDPASNHGNGNGSNGNGDGGNGSSIHFEELQFGRFIYPDHARIDAMQRGLAWILKMQNCDGGWSSFDKDNDNWVFTQVPFADHNAMIDPSTADLTGRVLEMLGLFAKYDTSHPVVQHAIKFLKRDQCEDGSWFGRWGVNYIYGTWQVLRGLRSVGEDMHADYVVAAANWLRSVQNGDGGWGESCRSYDDPSCKGKDKSSASQTAWALMGLFAVGDFESASVRRGVEYLIERQDSQGTWHEEAWTGAGFPSVFYLKYHLYQHYFPLMALGMYADHVRESNSLNIEARALR